MNPEEQVLTVQDLDVRIGRRSIVRDITFGVARGRTLGIVGESGSGKSMTVLAATGLLDAPASRSRGTSRLAGTDLIGASPQTLRKVHGARIGFVFQDPATSLHPLLTIERQLTETLEQHTGLGRKAAAARAVELLDAVGIPDPAARAKAYPHQLSGGQKQRVMIAIALACEPDLLVADEPTTALDVTTQKRVVELIQNLQERTETAVVWISHDLGVIGRVADEIAVLRSGDIVEHGSATEIFQNPKDDYTRTLLAARPTLGGPGPAAAPKQARTLLTVQGLSVVFPGRGGTAGVRAVDDVSFTLRRGSTLGIVGESGSGKSTIAAVLTGLVEAAGGTAVLHGEDRDFDLINLPRSQRREAARTLTMVFQDPFSSLDPRSTVAGSITEPLRVHGYDRGRRRARVAEVLDLVGLGRQFADRRPHELSGGQRQRVSIARALTLEPEVLILDEATSALDVSIQATVLDLLGRLQQDLGLAYLFIAHDLALVQRMSHDVLVLQNGRAQEYRPARELFAEPESAYTRDLLAAIPPAEPKAVRPHW